MKAVVNMKYGSPDYMELREVPRPEPTHKQVMVKVLATSVNKADWHILNGKPFPVRLMAGLLKPKYQILGADISGVVERVGKDVTQFQIGDEVFGDLSSIGFGGFAEYAIANEESLAKKPSNLNFEQSAALPIAAVTALQGLRNKGQIKAEDRTLINGASGGVGSFAIQIAKSFGAQVVAVCSTNKLQTALKLGADSVIDYTQGDFSGSGDRFNLVFDIIGNLNAHQIDLLVKKGGRYVSCNFSSTVVLNSLYFSLFKGKKLVNMLAKVNQADLQYVRKLAEEDKLLSEIQEVFTLDDVPEALHIMGKGSSNGKLVISV